MTEQVEGQISLFGPGSWCGKTSPEPCQAETLKAETSESCLKKQHGLRNRLPQFLDLRGGGNLQGASWVTGGPLLGEYTMRSFGECPNEDVESRLSQILEDNPHPKYCLTAKACQGILRRADKRGRELPEQLREALIRQAVLT